MQRAGVWSHNHSKVLAYLSTCGRCFFSFLPQLLFKAISKNLSQQNFLSLLSYWKRLLVLKMKADMVTCLQNQL